MVWQFCGGNAGLAGGNIAVRVDACAVAASQTRVPTTELPNHLAVRFSERLASERHHVRYGVEVDGLKFVAYLPADITKFYCYLIGDLALQREVELMAHARPE